MSAESTVLPVGTLLVDARELEGKLTDLLHGSRRGMRTTQKGYEDVITEIVSNHERLSHLAGITDTDLQRLHELNELIATFDKYLPAVAKLHELIRESRALADDQRERLVCALAEAVEARAKTSRDESLLAHYEKTRAYRSAPGVKAHATRRKREELAGKSDQAAPRLRKDAGV